MGLIDYDHHPSKASLGCLTYAYTMLIYAYTCLYQFNLVLVEHSHGAQMQEFNIRMSSA